MGVIYRELKQWDNALKYFREAGRIWTSAYGTNHQVMISNSGNQGRALIELGRYEEAKACYETILGIIAVLYDEKGLDHAFVHINLAKIYMAQGQYDKAIKACDIADTTLQLESVKCQKRSINLVKTCSMIREQVTANQNRKTTSKNSRL